MTEVQPDDEREQQFVSLADHLSLLSKAHTCPKGIQVSGEPFDAEDVDFDNFSSWFPRLLEVQGWLNLDANLSVETPEDGIRSLAELLIVAANDDDKSRLNLTDEVLTALTDRASVAASLCSNFIEMLEDGSTSRAVATEEWGDAWHARMSLSQGTGPVAATTSTLWISDIITKVGKGRIELNPSFQRSDVWPTADAQKLIESILRGIPLPSVILLRPKNENVMQVVDGKQRITSILRFVGAHPEALAKVTEKDNEHPDKNLLKLFKTDYPSFRRAWKAAGLDLSASIERDLKFPFKLPKGKATGLVNGLEHLQGKYYTQITGEKVLIAGEEEEVRDVFFSTTDYKVPIIQYLQATQRQIHEVFGLYNRQGKQLNAEEIRNAVYHQLDFARGVLAFSGDNPDVDAVAPFLRPKWTGLEEIGHELKSYGFGTSRFKRSKVLSWVLAHLIIDSKKADGSERILSTAKLIDDMYNQVGRLDAYEEIGEPHPLENQDQITGLFQIVATAIQAHSAYEEAWHPAWINKSGKAGWQELQLVASLLGVTMASVQHGSRLDQVLSSKAAELQVLTGSKDFEREDKTQTATQWGMIARWSVGIARVLEVDLTACDKKIRKQFGGSGVSVLENIADRNS